MFKISTDKAPAAVGPYSQAIKTGNFLFVSGQIPLNPQTQELVSGINAQTIQVLENLKAVLEAGGSSIAQVIKVTIYLTDMNDFSTVNEIYAKYFMENQPARACVAVKALPKNADVEMDAIALCE